MSNTPAFRTLLKSIGNEEILVPMLRSVLHDPSFNAFTIEVEGFVTRPPDGWFWPSTHPTWNERHLYEYVTNPARLLGEPMDPTGTLAVTAGSFFHAQPLWAQVHTPSGWISMGEVAPGCVITGGDGRPTEVVVATEPSVQKIYRVSFSDGAVTYATADHLWQVQTKDGRQKGKSKVVRTSELVPVYGSQVGHSIPLTVTRTPEADLPVHPYVLGALLGDGCFRGSSISLADKVGDVAAAVALHRPVSGGASGLFYLPGMKGVVRELGLDGVGSADKWIPDAYLWSSVDQRMSLLKGLLDTDGTIQVSYAGRSSVKYGTISERLRDGVVSLVRSLGGIAHVTSTVTPGGQPYYIVSIRGLAESPFAISRKADRFSPTLSSAHRFVVSVEEAGEDAVRCLMVRNPDGLYVTDDYVVTHNTFVQTVLVREGILEQQPKVCGCGREHPERAEVYLVDPEAGVRGHSDGVVHDGSGFEFKGLDVSTPILTPQGWKTMLDLHEGDEVFSPDGQPTKVTGAHPVRIGQPCYRLTFADGQQIVADDEHLWEVEECVSTIRTSTRVLTTREIAESEVRAGDRFRFRVVVPEPVTVPDADLSVDPWVLGMWLGDGVSREGMICVGEQDLQYVASRLEGAGEQINIRKEPGRRVYRIRVYGLATRLRSMGILGKGMKRIPPAYFTSSERQRRALFAGIMDSDGSVGGHHFTVTMQKQDLMGDVASLGRSLGIRLTLREYRAHLNGSDAGPMWRVQFPVSSGEQPFLLPRKIQRTAELAKNGQRTRSTYNAIVAVEPVESRPTRCITVAHESAMYLAGSGFLPTHNTMTPLKLDRAPRGTPTDPEVLKWFRTKCADYYAQAQEYLRMSGRRRMIVLIVSLTYPFNMREIHVAYDHAFATATREKYLRVREAVKSGTPPRCICGPQSKTCPARAVCW